MPFPEMVDSMLKDLLQETGINLSIKIRAGLNNTDELWRMLDVLNKYPICKIILHPRLGIQMYDEEPDLDVFSLASTQTKHNLVYNGDITTPEYFARLQERFPGTTEWMIGRGVLMNPFLPGILKGIKPPDTIESVNILKAFHQDLMNNLSESGCGEKRMADKAKEYWNYFSHWFSDQQHVWHEISRSQDMAGVLNAIEKAFKGDLRFFC